MVQVKKNVIIVLMDALDLIPDMENLGCNRNDIGTHSNRKFAESTTVSKVDGPSRTQVCLRAGQSVGKSQDCYIFAEQDGDSLVGHTVAQLKFDADEFDVLPCHFSNESLNELFVHGWNKVLPDYDKYPNSFQQIVRFMFASLVYHFHKGDLHTLFPPDHLLFS
jgi:3-oxoacyl-[acyl-carrier-protein] synthase III